MNKIAAVDISGLIKTPFVSQKGLPDLVNLFLTGSIAIAGIIFIFLIITSSYAIIAGSGKGSSEQVSKGIKTLTIAIIGLIIIIFAFPLLSLFEKIFFQTNTPFTAPTF